MPELSVRAVCVRTRLYTYKLSHRESVTLRQCHIGRYAIFLHTPSLYGVLSPSGTLRSYVATLNPILTYVLSIDIHTLYRDTYQYGHTHIVHAGSRHKTRACNSTSFDHFITLPQPTLRRICILYYVWLSGWSNVIVVNKLLTCQRCPCV